MSEKTRTLKNAGYLYARTVITTLIGIYTARIVIQTLGIEDYGIYGVTGSVVAMLGFINASMSGATSRFITFELGKGDRKRLHNTFCTAMVIHIGIALLVLVLAETVGLWFLCNKMVIPEGREQAAQWVYHLSILSTMLTITQVPYGACMIAHEKFNVYAFLDMAGAFAKLGILYLVRVAPYDHLIFYALLMMLISAFSCLYARIYCIRHFPESRFRWVYDKEFFKPMLSFSGWEMFGSLGWLAKQSGTNMLVNMFYGVAVNAAVSIGSTVSGAVNGLAYNVVAAFQPGITKNYAKGLMQKFEESVVKAATYSFILFNMFAVPLILERDFVLKLWLGVVPPYAADICALHLAFNSLVMITAVLNTTLKAMGKNGRQNVNVGVIGLSTVILVYLTMKTGHSPVAVFLVFNAVIIFNLLCNLYLIRKYATWSFTKRIIMESILRPLFFEILILISLAGMIQWIEDSIWRLCVVCFASVLFHAMVTYRFLITESERDAIRNKIKTVICH